MATVHMVTRRRGLARRLAAGLGEGHTVTRLAPAWFPAGEPDLLILEGAVLERLAPALAGLRPAPSGATVPVLLVAPRRSVARLAPDRWAVVDDVATTPVAGPLLRRRVGNLLERRRLETAARPAGLAGASPVSTMQAHTARLRENPVDTVFALTRAGTFRDEDTGAHIRRISAYCAELCDALGTSADFRDSLYHASALHDVGKIGIPDDILLKPGGLTAEEWATMKTHTEIGERILAGGEAACLQMGATIARHHHERYDGTGYPDGLAGEAIPLSARLMSLCDVYDALRSARPYKAPFDHGTATAIITEGDRRTRPEHFDPAVLAAFRRISGRFAGIFEATAEEG